MIVGVYQWPGGHELQWRAPRTAREVLDWTLGCVQWLDEGDLERYLVASATWAAEHIDGPSATWLLSEPQDLAADRTLELTKLCRAICEGAGVGAQVSAQFEELLARFGEPTDRLRSACGCARCEGIEPVPETNECVYDGVGHAAMSMAAFVGVVQDYGPQILDAPYWAYEACAQYGRHRSAQRALMHQEKEDVETTLEIHERLFGGAGG